MIKTLFSFLILLSHMQLCFGAENVSKTYIPVDQIMLCEEGIVIYLEEGCLFSPSIFHDEDGFYYLEEGAYWICRNCGAFNDLDNTACYRCGES